MRDLNTLTLVQADKGNLFRLNRFYRRNGHKGKAHPEDLAWWLEQEGEILAALRLEQHPWGQLLRGMWVSRDHRGQGLGSRLLVETHKQLRASPCYCLPYLHLTEFYNRNGFVETHNSAPQALKNQLQGYTQRGEQLSLMRYQPPCD